MKLKKHKILKVKQAKTLLIRINKLFYNKNLFIYI